MRDLEFCDEAAFPLLFQFKIENEHSEQVLIHESVQEYNKVKINPQIHVENEKMNRAAAKERRKQFMAKLRQR